MQMGDPALVIDLENGEQVKAIVADGGPTFKTGSRRRRWRRRRASPIHALAEQMSDTSATSFFLVAH